MLRIPKSFTTKQIQIWVDEHMNQLPQDIQSAIEEGNVYDAFRLGLFTGVINGIRSFSSDLIPDLNQSAEIELR